MAKTKIIYTEDSYLFAKYDHPQSHDLLEYKSNIEIKDSGKKPITMNLKFCGTYPYATPMPPEEHQVKAENILDLHLKISRWFKKFGYIIK
ncbi:MAG: hypothetical protein HRT88_15050 [Lentisphaeraceae bacterium]|nr:hypothetical protein [Lentisphaeraceae bacterium]